MRAYAKVVAVLTASAALAVPAAALGATGGATAPDDGPSGVTGPHDAIAGQTTTVRGFFAGMGAGRAVAIQLLGRSGWTDVARATTLSDGSFRARWRPRASGVATLRALPAGAVRAAQAGQSAPAVGEVNVYRPAIATWYGPGFYGSQTACGERLTPQTLGVANRTLPCGTPVRIYFHGRSIVVPVIDRGPYGGAASFDLSGATATALRFDGSQRIGFLASPARAARR